MRNLRPIIAILLICAFALIAENREFPEFKAKDVDGGEFVLSKFVAEGPIILTFWATWCKPCLKELEKLTEMQNFLDAHGVRVLAINTDGPRTRGKAKPFAQKNNWQFTIVMDPDGSIKSLAGVAEIPEMFILDTNRIILHHHVGYKPGDEVEYRDKIKTLFPIDGEE
jgi:peroxiredoxin